jgi:hypothetical protein
MFLSANNAPKSLLLQKEQAAEWSQRNLTHAEAEEEQAATTDVSALPDNYHELLRCIGTYCALLHTLFGPRCVFYKHCFILWNTMHSDVVYKHRTLFTELFCCKIVWAVLEEGRAYFSQRLSPDDFAASHPDDIVFPRSMLILLENNIRTQTPILRSSFPLAWMPTYMWSATHKETALTRHHYNKWPHAKIPQWFWHYPQVPWVLARGRGPVPQCTLDSQISTRKSRH